MSETQTTVYTADAWNSSAQVSDVAAKTWVYNPGSTKTTSTYSSTKTGVQMRDWKRRIAMGRNATTSFSGSESYYSSAPALLNVYGSTTNPVQNAALRKSATKWSHDINTIPALPASGDVTTATNIAAARFNKQVSDVLSAFQGGVFLAELRETLHMIRHPAQALRERISDYTQYLTLKRRRYMRRPPVNRLKFLSDSWLEYSFGWSPLLNDLDSARNVLDKRANQLVQELVRVGGTHKVESASFWTGDWLVGSANWRSDNRTFASTQVVYSGAVSSRASGSKLLTMSALGLSPRAFVPTLWEAMPYSFLIDYFSNVGDVLEAWSNQTADLAWGRKTVRRSQTNESGRCRYTGGLAVILDLSIDSGKTIARNKTVTREPIDQSPMPALQFELPGFGRKWINLSALATARRSLRFR